MFMNTSGDQNHPLNGTFKDQNKIYLKKTSYKFVDSVIQEESKQKEVPQKLSKILGRLETERVYEIVF